MYSTERGRLTGINGMESVLTLRPEHMGPRIKKSVIRMLNEAHITGGWSSKARAVAEQLADHYQLNMLQPRWRGVRLYKPPVAEVRDKLIEFVRADISAYLLESSGYSHKYYRDQAAEYITELENGTATYIDFHDTAWSNKAVALVNSMLTDEDRARIAEVVDKLVTNQPIYITTIRS